MNLSEKITTLRKRENMSQEELANRLNVSRQAVSRWESGTALPDALNILRLSKLFDVTTDYILNDDYESDKDIPIVKNTEKEMKSMFDSKLLFIVFSAVSMIIFIGQIIAFIEYQYVIWSLVLTGITVLSIAIFETVYKKTGANKDKYYKYYYKFTAVTALYFPSNILGFRIMHLYPRPYSILVPIFLSMVIYVVSIMISFAIVNRKSQ